MTDTVVVVHDSAVEEWDEMRLDTVERTLRLHPVFCKASQEIRVTLPLTLVDGSVVTHWSAIRTGDEIELLVFTESGRTAED